MIGTLLSGRFRLEEHIGSGGMSTVYRAFDETLERMVAIKIMHGALSDDPLQHERFRREARHVARLSHPHVVTVIDAGEDDGHPYIVFEYVEGETLKQRIKRCGVLPVVEAVAYAIEIGRALSAAHEQRLVHRDVKPQNVLIDLEGRAKVTDFGIARVLDDANLTATGRVLGTTDYVAPEQALGEDVTAQSDVYSLGVCLYEMLAGDVPFRAENQVAVAMKHVREPMPNVQLARGDVSAALAAVVERATAKERRNRYQSVDEMVWDLEQALAIEAARHGEATGEATTVLRALPEDRGRYAPGWLRRPGRYVAIAALTAVAAVAAVLLLAADTGGPRRGPSPASAAGGPLARVPLRTARDYDPYRSDGEHPELVGAAIDHDPRSSWTTQQYAVGALQKPGVGIYVDAGAPIAARRIDVRTTTPGFLAHVFGTNRAPAATGGPSSFATWGAPLASVTVGSHKKAYLATRGRPFRYYLLWIVRLPAGKDQVAIETIRLLK